MTHRLMVLLDPATPANGWPTDAAQVRARVEPSLESWVGRVLGPASRVRVRARYTWPGGDAAVESDLGVVRLSALDVLAMTSTGPPDGASPLEERLLEHFQVTRPAVVPATATAQLDLRRDAGWGHEILDLAELFELARSLRELLDGTRPLEPRDLALPGDAAAGAVDTADVAARAGIAVAALERVRAQLAAAVGSGSAVTDALRHASQLGVPRGSPGSVLAELDRRRRGVTDAQDDAARIAAALGDAFHVLPVVSPGGDLARSFADSASLQGGDALAAVTWLQRAAHVREGVSRLEQVLLCAEATGSPEALSLHVAQLPHTPGNRWAALPGPVIGGRVSIVAQASAAPGPGARVTGLVVDEWTEVIPARTQVTGLSFHVDQPNSRAPQAILLSVPPTEEHVWTLDALEATVLETLDLARLRLVDLEALGRGDAAALTGGPAGTSLVIPRPGHFLPATYLAAAPSDRTVTTDLGRVSAPQRPD